MKKIYRLLTPALLAFLLPSGAFAQLELKTETLSNPDNEPVDVHPVPHPRQL